MSSTYSDRSLKKKSKKNKHGSDTEERISEVSGSTLSESLSRIKLGNESPASQRSSSSSNQTLASSSLPRRPKKSKEDEIEMGIKHVEMVNEFTTINTVEVIKRPGQTLGFYIREGNGKTTKKGVFISRVAEGSVIQRNGLLKVGDEIISINSVNVQRTNLDDVVVLMSIPKKLVLQIRSRKIPIEKHRASAIYANPMIVYTHRSDHSDTDSLGPRSKRVELNPEDSNDSGLSSEHSLKGEVKTDPQTNGDYNLPLPAFDYQIQSINQPPVVPAHSYTQPRPIAPPRTDLYASDGEHDYNPSHLRKAKAQTLHRQVLKPGYKLQLPDTENVFNSDSEVHHTATSKHSVDMNHLYAFPSPIPRSLQYGPRHRVSTDVHDAAPYYVNSDTYASPKPTTTKSDVGAVTSTRAELDNYRSELWKQEKMLNDVIQNMASALTVDTLLQQPPVTSTPTSTAGLFGSLPRHTPAASAYNYLKELPLLIKTPMKIHIDEFTLYRPEHDRTDELNPPKLPVGSLKVKVYCGHGLKSSRTTLRDLYCILQLDKEKKAKSMIRTGAINFDWDEVFTIEMNSEALCILCLIYHWDPNSRHLLCFTGTIRLANVFNITTTAPQNVKCALKLQPKGIVYIELSYCKTPALGEKPVFFFGAALKETLSNERNEDRVPVILRKCISEVNSRGLGVVGLYRLCGGAKKKSQLRQEFERHPQLVDLTEQNVPEIHVVTGLIKDYLRELPDPVISESAFKVIERATVIEANQDDSNDFNCAELINEFVANLQPWQQGTVVYLFNHLRQVANHCADNRMSTSNLAVCFAPVLGTQQDSEEKDANTEALNMKINIDVVRYLLDIWPANFTTNNNIVL